MSTAKRYLYLLHRLNDLEGGRKVEWVQALTKREQQVAIETARAELPEFILGHHDRRLARGKPSVARVREGVCTACHLRLPRGHHHSRGQGQDLDVCDHCGVFLDWEEIPMTAAETSPAASETRTENSAGTGKSGRKVRQGAGKSGRKLAA